MTTLDQYANRYRNIRFERRDGILQVTLHTNGGSLMWGGDEGSIHSQLGDAFRDIAHDRDNKVMILTGTGEVFCTKPNPDEFNESFSPEFWYRIFREGRELLMNLLDIDVPVISAINGPALIHSELPVLADIVLAAEHTAFRDTHMRIGVVPGDGCHSVWNLLLGRSRGHYYLMTGEKLSVQDAHRFGVVHEIHPADKVLARAWEIAGELVTKPLTTLRYSRMLFAQPIKEIFQRDLGFGLALEGLSNSAITVDPLAKKP